MNLRKNIGICFPSISHDKYLIVSVRMLFREYSCKNAGVAGYAEAFTTVRSEKQTSETYGYLSRLILEAGKTVLPDGRLQEKYKGGQLW